MVAYYVDKRTQASGEHEVHRADCAYLPSEANRLYLGAFANFFGAARETKKYYSRADGCRHCCSECHLG